MAELVELDEGRLLAEPPHGLVQPHLLAGVNILPQNDYDYDYH